MSKMQRRFLIGDRICLWMGDSVTCGVIRDIDLRFSAPVYETVMDTDDGAPIPQDKQEPHPWSVRADDDIWLESAGPDALMRAKILEWYDGKPPVYLQRWLDEGEPAS